MFVVITCYNDEPLQKRFILSQHAIFPAQILDVKAAVRWLRASAESYNLDPGRFGAWGSPAGSSLYQRTAGRI
ncbi:hypothetical protein ACFLXI_09305 [Chloroflexota bacterium]